MQTKQVYLLHFDQPIGGSKHQAQHYIGSATELMARLTQHQNGTTDSCIMRYLWIKKIGFTLVRTWDGNRTTERALKNRKKARALCPICSGKDHGEAQYHFPSPEGARPEYITQADLQARADAEKVEIDF